MKPTKSTRARGLDKRYPGLCQQLLAELKKAGPSVGHLQWMEKLLARDEVRYAMVALLADGAKFNLLFHAIYMAHLDDIEVRKATAAMKQAVREWPDTVQGLRARVQRIADMPYRVPLRPGPTAYHQEWVARMHDLIDQLPEKPEATIQEGNSLIPLVGRSAPPKVAKRLLREELLRFCPELRGRRQKVQALVEAIFPSPSVSRAVSSPRRNCN